MNKKYIWLILFFLIFTVLFRINYLSTKNKGDNTSVNNPKNLNKQVNDIQNIKNIDVKLDFGDKNVTQATVAATSAFEALDKTVREKGITMKTKKYDFGIFIESIGDYSNTKDKAWIYHVNGKSATQAADIQEVKPGDKLEWKYEKPTY